MSVNFVPRRGQTAAQVLTALDARGFPHKTGLFYDCSSNVVGAFGAATGVAAASASFDDAAAFQALAKNGYDQFTISVSAAGTAAALGRMAVYTMGVDGLPDALVADSGTFAVDAIAAPVLTVAVPTAFGSYYWLIVNHNAAAVPSFLTYNGNACINPLGYTSGTDVVRAIGIRAARTFAAFPASLAGVTWARVTGARAIRLRAA